MVNKWAVLGVDANASDCTLCCKPVPINHSLEQVNQHVWDKTHNFYLMRSFQVLSLDSLKVLQVLNLPNKSIFR